MKIETKFDIGDKVWAIYRVSKYEKCKTCGIEGKHVGETWKVDDCFTITFVSVCFRKEKNENAQRWTEYRASGTLLDESKGLFPTKKAAQAECDKRNKEGKC